MTIFTKKLRGKIQIQGLGIVRRIHAERDAGDRLCNGLRNRRAIKYVTLADCASDELYTATVVESKEIPPRKGARTPARPRSAGRTARRTKRAQRRAAVEDEDGRREMWAWHLRGMTAHPLRP